MVLLHFSTCDERGRAVPPAVKDALASRRRALSLSRGCSRFHTDAVTRSQEASAFAAGSGAGAERISARAAGPLQ